MENNNKTDKKDAQYKQIEKEDIIIQQHTLQHDKQNEVNNSQYRLSKKFWDLLNANKELIDENFILIKNKNPLVFDIPEEKQDKEEINKYTLLIQEKQKQIADKQEEFRQFLPNWMSNFLKDDAKDHINFPKQTSSEWRQVIYNYSDSVNLQYDQTFRKKDKFCSIWKKGSQYEKVVSKPFQEKKVTQQDLESINNFEKGTPQFVEKLDSKLQQNTDFQWTQKQQQDFDSKSKKVADLSQQGEHKQYNQEDKILIDDEKSSREVDVQKLKKEVELSKKQNEQPKKQQQQDCNNQTTTTSNIANESNNLVHQIIQSQKYQESGIQTVPDQIKSIEYLEFNLKTQKLQILFPIPENNGGEISSFILVVKYRNIRTDNMVELKKEFKMDQVQIIGNQNKIQMGIDISQIYKNHHQGLNYNQITQSIKFTNYMSISSQNQFGLSDLSKQFKFQLPDSKNQSCHLFMTGSAKNTEIPTEESIIPKLEDPQYFDSVQNKFLSFTKVQLFEQASINQVQVNDQCIVKLSNGSCANWGKIIGGKEYDDEDEQEDEQTEFTLEEVGDKMTEFNTIPFSPTDSLQIIINKVSCGIKFCGITTIDGNVYTWGENFYGQLGHHDTTSRLNPTLLSYFQKKNIFISDIVAGSGHFVALTEDQRVYSWGLKQAREGQGIMNRQGDGQNFCNLGKNLDQPILQDSLYEITQISAFANNSACISSQGKLYTWGDNEHDQLGIQQPVSNLVLAVPQTDNRFQYKSVSVGLFHSIATAYDKELQKEVLLVWGDNEFGQCGILSEQMKNSDKPIVNTFFNDKIILQISAGAFHSFVLCEEEKQNSNTDQKLNKQKSELFGFGQAIKGELGIPKQERIKIQYQPISLNKYININQGLDSEIVQEKLQILNAQAGFENSAVLIQY